MSLLRSGKSHALANASFLLGQKMKDLNISTSFISDAEDPESSSDEKNPKNTNKNEPDTNKNSRESVLALVGEMFDKKLLTDSEAQQAVCLAMKADNTFELMSSLLRARPSLRAQSVFLKMWLSGFRDEKKPSSSKTIALCEPSPPLMPISLHFSDTSSNCSPTESPIANLTRAPTPSILLSEPKPQVLRHFKKSSSSTVSTESPSPQLIFANMMGRGDSTSSDDCGV